MKKSYCPSCGHPLCGRCKKDPVKQVKQEVGDLNGADAGEQHRRELEEEGKAASAAVARESPYPVAPTPLDDQQQENIGAVGGGDQEGQTIRKSNGEIITVGNRLSVKTNPFVIADQIAKAKVLDPEVSSTTTHVIATPPSSKPPKYDLTPVVNRKRLGPVASTDASEHPRTQQSQREPNLGRLSHSYASSSRGSSVAPPSSPGGPSNNLRMLAAAEEREKEITAALQAKVNPHAHRQGREPDRTTPSPSSQATNDRTHVLQQQAKREKGRSTPPVLRRVKILAERDKSGALQQFLQLGVDNGGPEHNNDVGNEGGRTSAKSIPRARVNSPPAWLRNPSAAVVAQPGSIAGRLRRVDADKAIDSNKTKSSPQLYQQPPPAKEKEERGTTDSTTTVTVIGSGQPGSTSDPRKGSGFGSNSLVSPRGVGRGGGSQQIQAPRSYPFAPARQSVSGTGPSISTGGPGFSHQQQQHPHGSSGFWKVPSSVNMNMAVSRTTSEATIDGSRFGGPRGGGGTDTGTGTGTGGTGTLTVEGDDDDDVGIQGLTIVLHLRGKDDLVISTNLSREGGGGGGGGGGGVQNLEYVSKPISRLSPSVLPIQG
ncbi:hypothetical protein QBC36DRAFT_372585 [Triangularia setosa]|uniref:Uncharacterized protein n=1 Tax=Triangularia setosa TaxID=2587417 RepID=A0AAN6W8A9_9PEZI|nr:hypothetical protein QBC36DRAFT_372585 [Podospora setosa]